MDSAGNGSAKRDLAKERGVAQICVLRPPGSIFMVKFNSLLLLVAPATIGLNVFRILNIILAIVGGF